MIDAIKCEREGVKALHDGPIDPVQWFLRVDSDQDRVLFLLKNAYDATGHDMGGYDLCEGKRELNNLEDVKNEDAPPTYIPMIYICNMLENDCSFSQVNIETEASFSVFKASSAWVNVDKELWPKDWRTNESKLARAAKLNYEVLCQQMKTYRPNVIICGGTLKHFIKTVPGGYSIFEFQIPASNIRRLPHTPGRFCYYNDQVIIFDAYHPSSATSFNNPPLQHYCNDIVSAIKEWKEE